MIRILLTFVPILIVSICHSQTIGRFECHLPAAGEQSKAAGVDFLYADSVKAAILYCVDSAQNNVLPSYFSDLPGKIEDFFTRTSHGKFKVDVVQSLTRDLSHAFRGTVRALPDKSPIPEICLDPFIRNILIQADSLYDFGQL